MMRAALIFAVFAVVVQAESVRDHIVRQEGYSHHAYDDREHLAIGVGHRFKRGERRAFYWTTAQIEKAFARDLAVAQRGAERSVSDFSSHPESVRVILIALSYNVGAHGLNQFALFRTALNRHDYQTAAYHLRMSRWARQLPDRAAEYVSILSSFPPRRFVLP